MYLARGGPTPPPFFFFFPENKRKKNFSPYEKDTEKGMSEIVTSFDIFLNPESSGNLFCEVLEFQNEGCGDSC